MRFRTFLSFLTPKNGGLLLVNFIKWWWISFICLIIGRIIFFFENGSRFLNVQSSEHINGLWIDAITNSLYSFPVFCVIFLLSFFFTKKWWMKTANFTIGLLCLWFLSTNFIDSAYFKYRFSRSTRELFEMLFSQMDLSAQFGGIFQSYWWLFLLLFILTFCLILILRKWIATEISRPNLKQSAAIVLFLGTVFLIGRGGIRPRPIGVMDLSKISQNTNLVANTPFLLLKSVASFQLPDYNFMSEKEALATTQFHQKTKPQNILPNSTNLIVLVLESFGNEFVQQKEITPFLNSILDKSWRLKRSFANSITSMEAIPAIVSSMPTFSNVNYFSSNFGNNRLDGIPSILSKNGYSSAFFHGATNGSMWFDSFANSAGFDRYFGRSEYGNDSHFNGRWGIHDEYFLPWSIEKINTMEIPFFSLIFTLSAHHPYDIPKERKSDFQFKTDIENATAYADFCLQQFFEKAKKSDWFENTLFVLVADHTSKNRLNYHPLNAYEIPLAFYHPTIDLSAISHQPIASQTDIFPTILDLLNIESGYYSVGKSLFQKENHWTFLKDRNTFLNIKNDHFSSFQLDENNNLSIFTLYDWNGNKMETSSTISQRQIEAFLQQITQDVKSNQTTFDEKKYSIHN